MLQAGKTAGRASQRVVDDAAWLPCRHCGARFQPVRPHQLYCRPSCQWEGFKARQPRIVDPGKADRMPSSSHAGCSNRVNVVSSGRNSRSLTIEYVRVFIALAEDHGIDPSPFGISVARYCHSPEVAMIFARAAAAASLAVLTSLPAYADPLTVRYTVHVRSCESGRITPDFSYLKCGPHPAAFPLSVTFDTRVSTEDFGYWVTHTFGAPMFSTPPIALPEDPAPNTTVALTTLEGASDFRAASISSFTYFAEGDPNDPSTIYSRGIILFGSDSGSAREPSLAALIGLSKEFRFAFRVADPEEPAVIAYVEYSGRAVVDNGVVPEPATFLLVGTGAAAAARTGRRRSRLVSFRSVSFR